MDVHSLLRELAERRPVFHSEADFQHELAWLAHIGDPDAEIRLETRPLAGQALYLDLAVASGGHRYALELKYLTRALDVVVQSEQFVLRNQAAQDISRYDIVKDVHRLERIVHAGAADVGYAIVLTNDRSYWQKALRADTVDAEFRLHDGRELLGAVGWSSRAGAGTTRGREAPLPLTGRYVLGWTDYSRVADGPSGLFRYLAIEVIRIARDASAVEA